MAGEDKSFRHLFSFGGADTTVTPLAPAAPADAGHLAHLARGKLLPAKRGAPAPAPAPAPAAVHVDATARQARSDALAEPEALSDPEDDVSEVLKIGETFWRGADRTVDTIRADWFEHGRQDRLRADFKTARRNRAHIRQVTAAGGGGGGKRGGGDDGRGDS